MPDSPRIALLGTGTMGVGMAHSLLRAGLPVTAWNRHPERARPLADDGATVAGSAEEAVRGADVVITMLFDVDSVAEVIDDVAGTFGDDAVWLQMSTIGRDGTDRLAAVARQHGLTLVDAPVIGTKQPAEDGALTILAAGPARARDAVAPAFDAMGAKTLWLGDEPGPASALKLVANAWVATITAGTAQGVEMTRAFGIDPTLFLEAISGGAADSPYLQTKGAAIVEGRAEEAQFALDGLRKDLDLVSSSARAAGVPTDLLDVLARVYGRASDAGHGDEDVAAVSAAFQPAVGAPSDRA